MASTLTYLPSPEVASTLTYLPSLEVASTLNGGSLNGGSLAGKHFSPERWLSTLNGGSLAGKHVSPFGEKGVKPIIHKELEYSKQSSYCSSHIFGRRCHIGRLA